MMEQNILLKTVFSSGSNPILASVKLNYDAIKLNHLEKTAQLWLVGPNLIFLYQNSIGPPDTIQSQSENLGVNSRLQWRFTDSPTWFTTTIICQRPAPYLPE